MAKQHEQHAGDWQSIQGCQPHSRLGATTNISDPAVVQHALPDDYIAHPSRGSGDRIACGAIGLYGQDAGK